MNTHCAVLKKTVAFMHKIDASQPTGTLWTVEVCVSW